ncbi:MAG TPA: DUF2630 family protein [Acidimicrobiales bacterium]|jgi:hypothetical protein
MDDNSILKKVSDLTDEEKSLEDSHLHEPLSKEKLERLHAIDVELDQLWDLLRRRRASRAAGINPDVEGVRPESVVENYEQ